VLICPRQLLLRNVNALLFSWAVRQELWLGIELVGCFVGSAVGQ
jgi:hypothetical protein